MNICNSQRRWSHLELAADFWKMETKIIWIIKIERISKNKNCWSLENITKILTVVCVKKIKF